jgi:hypothetical protein
MGRWRRGEGARGGAANKNIGDAFLLVRQTGAAGGGG